jgi:glyoxylase-like metal-dependent hydrolase (beta-lactamase superfamily II)
MRSLGLDPRDVRWLVMTHLHTDHAGGLHHFPAAEVLVSAREYAEAKGLAGRLRGYLPNRWPAWFRPTLIDSWNADESVFGRAHVLTRAGDLRIVPTPGHTAGHISVVLEQHAYRLFFAGDASYTESALLRGVVDGVSSMGAGERAAADTLRQIRAYTAERPTVYLPSHDPDAARRLEECRTVDPSTPGVVGSGARSMSMTPAETRA